MITPLLDANGHDIYGRMEPGAFRVGRVVYYDFDDFHCDGQIPQIGHPLPELLPPFRRGWFRNHERMLNDRVFCVAVIDDLNLPPFCDRVDQPVKHLGRAC